MSAHVSSRLITSPHISSRFLTSHHAPHTPYSKVSKSMGISVEPDSDKSCVPENFSSWHSTITPRKSFPWIGMEVWVTAKHFMMRSRNARGDVTRKEKLNLIKSIVGILASRINKSPTLLGKHLLASKLKYLWFKDSLLSWCMYMMGSALFRCVSEQARFNIACKIGIVRSAS